MIKEYQVTMICESGKYKPVSCIIKKDTEEINRIGKSAFVGKIRQEGIVKICQNRQWGNRELQQYGYTKVKIREYDKERIAQENKARYEQFKEQMYQSGQWQRPAKVLGKTT